MSSASSLFLILYRGIFQMFTYAELIQASHGMGTGTVDGSVSGVSTDSRNAAPEDVFIALKGERFDGHDFVHAVAARGVRAFIVGKSWLSGHEAPQGSCTIAVDDTLRALGDLAAFYRSRFSLPVIGVTGSNGKTTTKEMLASILAAGGTGLKTVGNLNNLIGLPKMLLQLNSDHKWAVLEMGMSELGEIDRLAEIARPDIGIITNALPAHLETLGTVETVARAKGELFLRLENSGTAVFNADDPLISRCPSSAGAARLSFGLGKADVRAENIENHGKMGQTFNLCLPGSELPVTLRAFGVHNVYNALAASAAAFALGMDSGQIRTGLEAFSPFDKRFSLEEIGGIVLIDDSYNANPGSMKAALMTLRDIKEECRAIAVLGDMLELGDSSVAAHEETGRLAASCVERLFVIGEMSDAVAGGAIKGGLAPEAIFRAGEHSELLNLLLNTIEDGDYILVKGSRGMKMETVAEGIRNRRNTGIMKGAVA
jgi:UDP-N-acetylmuramoyl-tripeptide--D-alanyl-D-alanine ligase